MNKTAQTKRIVRSTMPTHLKACNYSKDVFMKSEEKEIKLPSLKANLAQKLQLRNQYEEERLA